MSNPSAKSEYLSKAVAAKRLGLSVRYLMDLAAQGKLERFKQFDPQTRRDTTVFDATDVAQLLAEWTPKPETAMIAAPASTALAVRRNGVTASPAPALPRLWLTLDEAADYSGLPASVLHRLIAGGQLPALDVGVRPGGRYRVRRADLDEIEGSICTPDHKLFPHR